MIIQLLLHVHRHATILRCFCFRLHLTYYISPHTPGAVFAMLVKIAPSSEMRYCVVFNYSSRLVFRELSRALYSARAWYA